MKERKTLTAGRPVSPPVAKTKVKAKSKGPTSVSPVIRALAIFEMLAGIALIPIGLNNVDSHPELIGLGIAALLGCPFLFAIAEVLVRLGEISANTKNLASMQIASAIKGDDHAHL